MSANYKPDHTQALASYEATQEFAGMPQDSSECQIVMLKQQK